MDRHAPETVSGAFSRVRFFSMRTPNFLKIQDLDF
jgi:hypothetical protein